MFIVSSKVKCEFCGVEVGNTIEASYSGHGAPLPNGWINYRDVMVCPVCQKKHTIAELRQKNKEVSERLEKREKEDEAEDY